MTKKKSGVSRKESEVCSVCKKKKPLDDMATITYTLDDKVIYVCKKCGEEEGVWCRY